MALAARVRMLLVVAGLVPNEAVTPAGIPVATRVTLPVNPPTRVTVIVSVPLLLFPMERLAAEGASVKFEVPEVTFRVMLVAAVSAPEVPLTLMVKGPVVAVGVAVSVSTLLPVAGLGLNEAVTPEGTPDADNVTLPVNPPDGVIVIESVTLLP